MGNIVIATPDLSDSATIAAGSETVAGPASNLQRMQPTDLWQFEAGASYITINLGAVESFNLIALLFCDAVASDTWRIRTADTEAGLTAAPDQDTTATAMANISPDGHVFHWVEAGWTNQWLRIDITVASAAFTAGRIYVANGFQPQLNYEYGAADGYDDDTIVDRAGSGALHPGGGYNRAVSTLTLNIMTEAERHAVREIHRLRGARKDVLVIYDPDAVQNVGDGVLYVLMQRRRDIIVTRFNRQQVTYQLTAL